MTPTAGNPPGPGDDDDDDGPRYFPVNRAKPAATPSAPPAGEEDDEPRSFPGRNAPATAEPAPAPPAAKAPAPTAEPPPFAMTAETPPPPARAPQPPVAKASPPPVAPAAVEPVRTARSPSPPPPRAPAPKAPVPRAPQRVRTAPRQTQPLAGSADEADGPQSFAYVRTAAPAAEPEAALPESFPVARIDGSRKIVKFRDSGESIDPTLAEDVARMRRRRNWAARIAWGAAGILVSFALGRAADELIRELWAWAPWLGWVATGVLAALVGALIVLLVREYVSLRRLRVLDSLRDRAIAVLEGNLKPEAMAIVGELERIYENRADLEPARRELASTAQKTFDGEDIVKHAERALMTPLDTHAKLVIGASARRVALVTAVSPRALVDISFVAYESIRLASTIARLYGGRPGLFGSIRLMGEVIAHLAVTGGLTLGDGILEQIFGHGVAERISSRLGEGLLNGLMTVRVGIAAMRVVRPLPFVTQRQPIVVDYLAELASITKATPKAA